MSQFDECNDRSILDSYTRLDRARLECAEQRATSRRIRLETFEPRPGRMEKRVKGGRMRLDRAERHARSRHTRLATRERGSDSAAVID